MTVVHTPQPPPGPYDRALAAATERWHQLVDQAAIEADLTPDQAEATKGIGELAGELYLTAAYSSLKHDLRPDFEDGR